MAYRYRIDITDNNVIYEDHTWITLIKRRFLMISSPCHYSSYYCCNCKRKPHRFKRISKSNLLVQHKVDFPQNVPFCGQHNFIKRYTRFLN